MKLFSQTNPFHKKKIYSFCLIILSTVLIIVGVETFSFQSSKAFDIIPSSVEIASNWQDASFPVENFQAYTSPFGYRNSPTGGAGREFHSGLDIAAPFGSYVRNWWGGEIVDLSDNTACGTMVVMKSGPWIHLYCHLNGHIEGNGNQAYLVDPQGNIRIRKGQQLPGGARIGRVGMTGRTTGPHLHWGLKYRGQYIDPAIVLRAMYRQQTA